MSIVSSSGSDRGTFGLREGVTLILVFGLLMTAGLVAQERAPDRTRDRALKGCLSATLQGRYQLADDETGTLYNLVGNPESLRMLVGNDVLLGGHSLDAREDEGAEEGNENRPRDALSGSDDWPVAGHAESGKSGTRNIFRVVHAVKVSDLCVLTSVVSASSPAWPAR